MRKIAHIFLVFAFIYLLLGLGFHLKWKSALDACGETRIAQGEYVEPEVFGNAFGALMDITWWPVYLRANLDHFDTPFSTPCDH